MQRGRYSHWAYDDAKAAAEHVISLGGGNAMLAELYGGSKEAWCTRLAKFGIESPSAHARRIHLEHVAAITPAVIAFVEAGNSQAATAKKFSISPSAVSRIIVHAGASKRTRITKAEMLERDEAIKASDLPTSELAEQYGCSRNNIIRIRNKKG